MSADMDINYEFAFEVAQRAAAMADALARKEFKLGERVKLGGGGQTLHYLKIASLAFRTMEKYPVDFDWVSFYAEGGSDWDILMGHIAETEGASLGS